MFEWAGSGWMVDEGMEGRLLDGVMLARMDEYHDSHACWLC